MLRPRDLRVEVALVRERCRGDHADPTREEAVASLQTEARSAERRRGGGGGARGCEGLRGVREGRPRRRGEGRGAHGREGLVEGEHAGA